MSTIKKISDSTVSKSNAKNEESAGSATGVTLGQPDPLPASLCPSPPMGWVPPPAARFTVSAAQIAAAPAAAAELSAAPSFATDFGPAAPPPEPLGAALTLAAAWSAEAKSAETYTKYAHAQEVRAWQLAAEGIRALTPCAELVLERRADTAKRYTGLKALLDVPKASAARGVATRKENRRAAKKTAAVVPDLPLATKTSTPTS